ERILDAVFYVWGFVIPILRHAEQLMPTFQNGGLIVPIPGDAQNQAAALYAKYLAKLRDNWRRFTAYLGVARLFEGAMVELGPSRSLGGKRQETLALLGVLFNIPPLGAMRMRPQPFDVIDEFFLAETAVDPRSRLPAGVTAL